MVRNQLGHWPAAYYVFELGETYPSSVRRVRAVDP
jgi:hypothetical protein